VISFKSWFLPCYCCDRKSRAPCAQSFAPWQQATIEITRRDHYIIACSRHIHIFLFFAHIPFVVNHTINAAPPERLQQHPLLFTTNHTDRTFFVWRLNSTRPSYPDHSTILLRSEIPSGMCAKLRTVAASNNRDHTTRSHYYCLFAPHTYIFVLRAHPVRGESHNQRNTTGEVATLPLTWFCNNWGFSHVSHHKMNGHHYKYFLQNVILPFFLHMDT